MALVLHFAGTVKEAEKYQRVDIDLAFRILEDARVDYFRDTRIVRLQVLPCGRGESLPEGFKSHSRTITSWLGALGYERCTFHTLDEGVDVSASKWQ